MIAKILPLILILVGLGAGIGAGIALRPAEEHTETAETPIEEAPPATEFAKLNNQFVIPVVEDGRVASLVIMSLSVEVTIGGTETVYVQEPKLRDALLQVMFDHANVGGFKGVFTDGANLTLLRHALLEVAQKVLGDIAQGILISDISRQDT
ncbi:flagellar basal body-associated protein FliL [Pseudorhodobacter turbinis]|uniref:Flagellar basal body-associated protein FliL n=1 Tax=Pseudorhodobacter turbinis TaxID=2500533 RepID=A0A4P8EE83_9RHOB|nr:flagellar basal body-associated protein FliL [Pseudorhodobacter turbinis]QCO55330.1 flagellar basal body-associated protein FliL [Pseudorhodobacter turbinis]